MKERERDGKREDTHYLEGYVHQAPESQSKVGPWSLWPRSVFWPQTSEIPSVSLCLKNLEISYTVKLPNLEHVT